jgi:hypothetical protein
MGWLKSLFMVLVCIVLFLFLFGVFKWWLFIIPGILILILLLIRGLAILYWKGKDRGEF